MSEITEIKSNLKEIQMEANDLLLNHENKSKELKQNKLLIDEEIKREAMKLFNLIFGQQVKLINQNHEFEKKCNQQLGDLLSKQKDVKIRLNECEQKLTLKDLIDSSQLNEIINESEKIKLEVKSLKEELNHFNYDYKFKPNETSQTCLLIGEILEPERLDEETSHCLNTSTHSSHEQEDCFEHRPKRIRKILKYCESSDNEDHFESSLNESSAKHSHSQSITNSTISSPLENTNQSYIYDSKTDKSVSENYNSSFESNKLAPTKPMKKNVDEILNGLIDLNHVSSKKKTNNHIKCDYVDSEDEDELTSMNFQNLLKRPSPKKSLNEQSFLNSSDTAIRKDKKQVFSFTQKPRNKTKRL